MSLAPFLSFLVFLCAIFSTKQPVVTLVLMTIETNFFNTDFFSLFGFSTEKKCR